MQRWHTETVSVPEEHDTLTLPLGVCGRLDPLAPPSALPHALKESNRAVGDVGSVVTTHDGLDGFGGFVGVIKGNGRHVVVKNMGLDDAVEKLAADETKLAVNGCGRATGIGPRAGLVVRKGGVSVLKECNGH